MVSRWPPLRRVHKLIALAVVVCLLVVGGVAYLLLRRPAQHSAGPSPVALTATGVPGEVSIGVIATLSSTPGEGDQWRAAAEGAQVAAYRFGLGGTKVRVHAVDDKGTSAGAARAVAELAIKGVAGIVVASEGGHLRGALDAAAARRIPLVLPYESELGNLPDVAKVTAPRRGAVDAALVAALRSAGARRPFLVDAGGGAPSGLTAGAVRIVDPAADPAVTAKAVAAAMTLKKRPTDSVVISGAATTQAALVRALQGANVDAPIVLSSDALSPQFATTLLKGGGSLAGQFATSGLPPTETVAMQPGDAGQAASAYFAGLRALAADPTAKDFFDGDPYADVAAGADSASHDAVVALVRAAARARSVKAANVAEVWGDTRLGAADGLAGPDLDFAGEAAVSDSAVVPLQSSTQASGVRPVSTRAGTVMLTWFRPAAR